MPQFLVLVWFGYYTKTALSFTITTLHFHAETAVNLTGVECHSALASEAWVEQVS